MECFRHEKQAGGYDTGDRADDKYREAIEAQAAAPGDIIDQAIVLWRAFNGVVLDYRERHPHWLFLRHEDVARDPAGKFTMLFEQLELGDYSTVRSMVEEYSSEKYGTAEFRTFLNRGRNNQLRRNSRKMVTNWKTLLSA